MQGKDAYARVGIRVGPGVGGCGVVDRKHLEQALVGLCHPVDHQLQVAEVAHTEAALRAEREHGDEGSCHLLVVESEECLVENFNTHLALRQRLYAERAVLACLPLHFALVAKGNKLELEVHILVLGNG